MDNHTIQDVNGNNTTIGEHTFPGQQHSEWLCIYLISEKAHPVSVLETSVPPSAAMIQSRKKAEVHHHQMASPINGFAQNCLQSTKVGNIRALEC